MRRRAPVHGARGRELQPAMVWWPKGRRRLGGMRTLAASSGDARLIRGIVGALALLLGAYCLLAAATALYAAPGQPDAGELAARERYQWPGWIPVVFLTLVG